MIEKLFDLSGWSVLIMGGSKGIGKVVVRGFVEVGVNVMILVCSGGDFEKVKVEVGDGFFVCVEICVGDMLDCVYVE